MSGHQRTVRVFIEEEEDNSRELGKDLVYFAELNFGPRNKRNLDSTSLGRIGHYSPRGFASQLVREKIQIRETDKMITIPAPYTVPSEIEHRNGIKTRVRRPFTPEELADFRDHYFHLKDVLLE